MVERVDDIQSFQIQKQIPKQVGKEYASMATKWKFSINVKND